jgi:hypothetical protein
MTFRQANKKFIEPIAQWVMVGGILALCQPWVQWLHEWSVAIMLLGLVTFLVSIHIAPDDAEARPDDDTVGPALKGGDHG